MYLADPTTAGRDHERILLIAADVDEAAMVLGELGSVTEESFQVEWVTDISSAIERLRAGGVATIVFDLNLPGCTGAECFDQLFHAADGIPILILSETETQDLARQALQRGAQDYLLKEQVDGYRLRRTVRLMKQRREIEARALENGTASATLNSIGEAILRTDRHGIVTYMNRSAERMTGWPREQAVGLPATEVLKLIDSATGEAVDNGVETVLTARKNETAPIGSIHCSLVQRNGIEVGIESRITAVKDSNGEPIAVVMSIRDVSLDRAASLEKSRVAQHDDLTNLPNRALFNDRLSQAIALAERQRKQLALLFLDLDQFKRINDSLGHAMGDKLLQSVAGRLTACVRRTDTVCRLGGDEFVILLSQVEHEEDAAGIARKILRAIASPHILDGMSLDVSVSIGGSTYPGDALDARTLISRADSAMYEAKLSGRNEYRFFQTDMGARAEERLVLEGNLRYALGRNEFLLHYQPKINLHTGQISGMEALIRWMHPERGLLYPESFVPIAEECGLIVPIGQWVLLEACRQSQAWSDSGMGTVPVAVNVSAAEFHAKDFLSGVRAVLIATGLEPANLEMELTESVLMEDAESAVGTLLALKAMGVRLAIDDFGIGYSSFSYLRRFPVDTIKVDRSFVQEIAADSNGTTLVGAIIEIGASLQRRVIAEGVETRLQLDFLQRHRCSEAQGYYFSPPLDALQAGSYFRAGLQQGMVQ